MTKIFPPIARSTHAAALFLGFAASIVATPALAGPDAATGQTLFTQRCAMCHASAPGKPSTIGPNLFGVVGRKPGSFDKFNYSPALKAQAGTWTPDRLSTFLAAPTKAVPGTRMPIAVPEQADRDNLIAYLKTLK